MEKSRYERLKDRVVRLSEVVIAIIGVSGTIILGLIGLYSAKRYNIGPNQEKLVSTLKDLVTAQQVRIEQLETLAKENQIQVAALRSEVRELKNLTVEQALTISHLEDELQKTRKGA